MIKHVLKDGTVLDDITGHVVRVEEAQDFYIVLGRIIGGGCYEKSKGEKIQCNS